METISRGELLHIRDGITFRNREAILPVRSEGYYKEYTVQPQPGQIGRGAERLVIGGLGEVFYTPNHYESFVTIR